MTTLSIYGLSVINSYDAAYPIVLPNSNLGGRKKTISLLNGVGAPLIINTSQGSFAISSSYPTRDLIFTGNPSWTLVDNYNNFFSTVQQAGPISAGVSSGYQGQSVSLSADGNTLAVGVSEEVYIYNRVGGKWISYSGNPIVGNSGAFGFSVSLSSDGTVLAVGVPYYNAPHVSAAGGVDIFYYVSGIWTPYPSNPIVRPGAQYYGGFSVSLSGNGLFLIFGQPGSSGYTGDSYIYHYNGTNWVEVIQLIGSGANGSSQQGFSVAFSEDGSTVAVGGPYNNTNQGGVWIFNNSSGTYTQYGSGPLVVSSVTTGNQGYSVALSADDTILASGAPSINQVFIFTLINGVWTNTATLTGSGSFGYSVSLSADGATLTVGSPSVTPLYNATTVGLVPVFLSSSAVGLISVFAYNSKNWILQSTLVGSNNTGDSGEGFSVAVSGNGSTTAFGGPFDNNNEGSVWIFI